VVLSQGETDLAKQPCSFADATSSFPIAQEAEAQEAEAQEAEAQEAEAQDV
jgi:hypothetical protein